MGSARRNRCDRRQINATRCSATDCCTVAELTKLIVADRLHRPVLHPIQLEIVTRIDINDTDRKRSQLMKRTLQRPPAPEPALVVACAA